MIRIIVIGSPFQGDDISYRVMDEIKPDLQKTFSALDICYLDRPGMQLVNELSNVKCAIVIDALLADSEPGTIRPLDVGELDRNNKPLSSHDLSVPQAIKLAQQLAVIPEQFFILGIAINPDQELNPQQLQQASTQLLAELDRICAQVDTD